MDQNFLCYHNGKIVKESNVFHVQTVNPVTGKMYWTKPVHSTIGDAISYAKKRCKDQQRILIWETIGGEIYLRSYMNDSIREDVIYDVLG